MTLAGIGLIAAGIALVAVGAVLLLDWKGATTWIARIWIHFSAWVPALRRASETDRLNYMRLRWRMTGAGWLMIGVIFLVFGITAPR